VSPFRGGIAVPDFKLLHTRALATLVTWATAAATIGLAAYWLTRVTAPRPVAALPASQEAPRGAGAEAEMARVLGVQAGGLETNLDGIVLTGVFAPHGDRGGFATFRTGKGGAAAVVGQEIAAGVRLERIEPGRVVVATGRGERVLELPKPRLDALAPTPAGAGDPR
jgi:hypothetical protein